jgi:hypothetical protein
MERPGQGPQGNKGFPARHERARHGFPSKDLGGAAREWWPIAALAAGSSTHGTHGHPGHSCQKQRTEEILVARHARGSPETMRRRRRSDGDKTDDDQARGAHPSRGRCRCICTRACAVRCGDLLDLRSIG